MNAARKKAATKPATHFEHGRLYLFDGWRVALVKVARVWAHVAFIADGNLLRTVRIPATDLRGIKPLPGYDTPASLARAMLRIYTSTPTRRRRVAEMTKAARALCQEIIDETNGRKS